MVYVDFILAYNSVNRKSLLEAIKIAKRIEDYNLTMKYLF